MTTIGKRIVGMVMIGGALVLAGCGTPVQKAELKVARDVPQGADSKPIQFRKVVVKMRRGEEIGEMQVGVLCLPTQKVEWKGGRVNVGDEEFTDVFREELQKFNYTVVGDPNALFEDPSAWKAELIVAGVINKLQVNACYPMGGFGNWKDSKGSTFVRVQWQIYGQLERKVVYETTTEGSYEATSSSSMGVEKALTNAFGVAVQNLLADAKFHKLVTETRALTSSVEGRPGTPLEVRLAKGVSGLPAARDATMTVYAGAGHGSGFLISSDGHVITNEHVVKEAKFVKVRLANGREVLGDVLRTNTASDVALIKLREVNLPTTVLALGIPPEVGAEVYAIGSPRSDSLDVTVTKGIVSGYRDERGQKRIQSDVQIHPGNSGGPLINKDGKVVGVAVAGLMQGGASQNLNFFLPIDDVVSGLNLVIR